MVHDPILLPKGLTPFDVERAALGIASSAINIRFLAAAVEANVRTLRDVLERQYAGSTILCLSEWPESLAFLDLIIEQADKAKEAADAVINGELVAQR